MPAATLIQRRTALEAFVAASADAPWLGLDTEFVRDRHYFARAGLIQIAAPEAVALVDPVALSDLSPLEPLLFGDATEKILHAGRQDLELLVLLFGRVPAPLFDTQVAAALLGMAPQIGYAALAETLLGAPPGPALGRYDWLKRPLAEDALAYAATDVAHLKGMRDMLGARLAAQERLEAFGAVMRENADPGLYRPRPEAAWRRVRQARRLGGAALARLQRLAAWRERQAMAEDRPRQWIVRDAVLVALARRAPESPAQLAAIEDLRAAARRRYAPALLAALGGSDEEDA